MSGAKVKEAGKIGMEMVFHTEWESPPSISSGNKDSRNGFEPLQVRFTKCFLRLSQILRQFSSPVPFSSFLPENTHCYVFHFTRENHFRLKRITQTFTSSIEESLLRQFQPIFFSFHLCQKQINCTSQEVQ